MASGPENDFLALRTSPRYISYAPKYVRPGYLNGMGSFLNITNEVHAEARSRHTPALKFTLKRLPCVRISPRYVSYKLKCARSVQANETGTFLDTTDEFCGEARARYITPLNHLLSGSPTPRSSPRCTSCIPNNVLLS